MTLFAEDEIDSGADVAEAGEEGCARRGTDWSPGMEVGKAHAFGRQLVENGSPEGRRNSRGTRGRRRGG